MAEDEGDYGEEQLDFGDEGNEEEEEHLLDEDENDEEEPADNGAYDEQEAEGDELSGLGECLLGHAAAG